MRFPPAPRPEIDASGLWLDERLSTGNAKTARQIWTLVDTGYEPIDWQLDFKSGYRWSERTWSRDIRPGVPRGADIKVPWELARMQHLPRFALAAAAPGTKPSDVATYRREFRNQVLDFIATNPPRFGVNWVTTMDVAIRLVNWLVAWDLFRAGGHTYDDAFELVFRRSVLDHARHIRGSLEWSPIGRGNHYLADVIGLLFAAAWLPAEPGSDGWFRFARSEVLNECSRQLQEDGSIFEASTCYHRLSAEMIAWAVGLIASVDGASTIPSWLLERLERAAEFSVDLTKPGGRIAQIGDNDSGRFLTFLPAHPLDHRHLLGLIGKLVGRSDLGALGADWRLEAEVLGRLTGPISPLNGARVRIAEGRRVGTTREHLDFERWYEALPADGKSSLAIPIPAGAHQGLRELAYPDFGYYIFRSGRLFLGIRCGSVGQDGVGGHAHNDQLAIELAIDDDDWLADPGTYLYTPFPEQRNAYRSVTAHAAPRLAGREPSRLDRGLFELGDPAVGTCIAFGQGTFIGELRAGSSAVRLRARIEDEQITLAYGFEGDAGPDPWRPSDWRELIPAIPFSPGYGLQDLAH